MAKRERKQPADSFKSFESYWSKARHLTETDRNALLRRLSASQRKLIEQSFEAGGWAALLIRNRLDVILTEIMSRYGVNLISVRCDVLSGRAVYVKKSFWKVVQERFSGLSEPDRFYIFGGYVAVEADNEHEFKLVLAPPIAQDQPGEPPLEADWH